MTSLNNSRGMTLIEILIVVTIWSAVGMGMVTVLGHLNASTNRMNAIYSMLALQSQIVSTLRVSATCKAAVAGGPKFDLNKAKLTEGAGSPAALTLSGGISIKQSTVVQRYDLITSALAYTNATSAGVDGAGNPIYRVDLWGNFESTRETSGGVFKGQTLTSLFVTVDAAQNILDCSTSLTGISAFNLSSPTVYSVRSKGQNNEKVCASRPHTICFLSKVNSGGFNSNCDVAIQNGIFCVIAYDPDISQTQSCRMTCLDSQTN